MPIYDDERYLRLPNPNHNESDFADDKRSQAIDESLGVGGVWSPLKSNGQWKVREFAFDKAKWGQPSACEQWVRTNRAAFKTFGPAPRRIECLEVGFERRSTGSLPTEAELEQIRSYMLEDIPPEELYVRTMRLTNDQWGKHDIKLARGFQRNVIASMPGKSLLLGHPEVRGVPAEPLGKFFDGWVDRDASTGTEWGYAKFYLVATEANAHARRQIDGGVWQYASIGMELDQLQCSICGQDHMSAACKHIKGNSYPKGQVKDLSLGAQADPADPGSVRCGVILRGQGTAIEGSIVFLPELNGTQVVAEAQYRQDYLNGDIGQAKSYLLSQAGNIDGAGLEGEGQPGDAEPNEADTTTTKEVEAMSDETKVLEASVATLTAEKGTLTTQLEQATAALEALQAEHAKTVEALGKAEPVIAAEAAFRAAAVAELTRVAGLAKREAELKTLQSIAKDDLSNMPAEQILSLAADWQKQFDEAHPNTGRQSTPSEGETAGTDTVIVLRPVLL